MLTVTFFGHAEIIENIRDRLKSTITQLASSHKSIHFLMGNNGDFDDLAYRVLRNISKVYPHIQYTIVLAHMPDKQDRLLPPEDADTIFPEEAAAAPRRFAIDRRNDWMCKRADLVITYVKRKTGGAAKFKRKAELRGIPIIELAANMHNKEPVP